MRTLMIGYDLNKAGQNYDDLIEAIKIHKTWWHHLDSTWLVRSELTAGQMRDALLPHIDENDELLVIDVTACAHAEHGFDAQGSTWLVKHI